MCTMTSPPTSKVRLTISVTEEVHATFSRLAKASNMSMSSAMGQWLEDTVEAANFMALKCEQAKAAPKLVMAEMHAYAMGLADETGILMESMRDKGRKARAKADGGNEGAPKLAPTPSPPSSNTGGKGPKTNNGKPVIRTRRQVAK